MSNQSTGSNADEANLPNRVPTNYELDQEASASANHHGLGNLEEDMDFVIKLMIVRGRERLTMMMMIIFASCDSEDELFAAANAPITMLKTSMTTTMTTTDDNDRGGGFIG